MLPVVPQPPCVCWGIVGTRPEAEATFQDRQEFERLSCESSDPLTHAELNEGDDSFWARAVLIQA